jgi:hypothetical protein
VIGESRGRIPPPSPVCQVPHPCRRMLTPQIAVASEGENSSSRFNRNAVSISKPPQLYGSGPPAHAAPATRAGSQAGDPAAYTGAYYGGHGPTTTDSNAAPTPAQVGFFVFELFA